MSIGLETFKQSVHLFWQSRVFLTACRDWLARGKGKAYSMCIFCLVLRPFWSIRKFNEISVFRPLDVDLFASHLHQNVPHEFFSEGRNVKWCPHDAGANGLSSALPNPRWISTVWNFLREVVTVKLKKSKASEDSGESQNIRKLLSPLSKLCILPATVQLEVFFKHLQLLENRYSSLLGVPEYGRIRY